LGAAAGEDVRLVGRVGLRRKSWECGENGLERRSMYQCDYGKLSRIKRVHISKLISFQEVFVVFNLV
jgi:hypothetical protein